jgi:hypothetical protein
VKEKTKKIKKRNPSVNEPAKQTQRKMTHLCSSALVTLQKDHETRCCSEFLHQCTGRGSRAAVDLSQLESEEFLVSGGAVLPVERLEVTERPIPLQTLINIGRTVIIIILVIILVRNLTRFHALKDRQESFLHFPETRIKKTITSKRRREESEIV